MTSERSETAAGGMEAVRGFYVEALRRIEALRRAELAERREPQKISSLQLRRLAEAVVRDGARNAESAEISAAVHLLLLNNKALRLPGFWTEPLALLTKVYQWRPGRDEVSWLMYSFPERHREALFPALAEAARNALAHLHSVPRPEAPTTLFPELERQTGPLQALADIVTVCELAQRIMRTAFEDRGIAARDLDSLNQWLGQAQNVRLVYDPRTQRESGRFSFWIGATRTEFAPDEDPDEHSILSRQLLPLANISEKIETLIEWPAGLIANELKRVVLEDTRLLSRCEECQSIFERNRDRPEQRFCSLRCADRNGQRRRKKNKEEES